MYLNWYEYLMYCSLGMFLAILIADVRRIQNPFHFGSAFLALMFMTYVIRPFLAFTIEGESSFLELYFPGSSSLVNDDLGAVAIAFVLAVLFFSMGYRVVRRPLLNSIEKNSPVNSTRDHAVLWNLAILMMVVGYSSFIFAQRGGLFSAGTVQYTRFEGGVVFSNTTGYVEYANYLVVAGATLFFATTKRFGITIVLAAPWVINQVYSGWQRYMFLNLAICLAIVAWIHHRQHSNRMLKRTVLVIATAILALLLLISMRGNRDFLQEGRTVTDLVNDSASMPIDEMLGDFAGFEGTWYTIRNVEAIEPYYGASIFYRMFILPVPRLLWPSKPLKVEFGWETLIEGNTNQSQWRNGLQNVENYVWYNTAVKGSIGYALEEWGWIGIPINFFLTGLFFAYVERRFSQSDFSPIWLSTYAATYALISMQGRSDLPEFLIIYILIFYLPYFLIHKIFFSSG